MGSSVEKLVAKDPHRPLSRAVLWSALLHASLVAAAWWLVKPVEPAKEIVDIELAPPPPKAEALPAEIAKPPAAEQGTPQPAAHEPAPEPDEATPIDAGIDAPIDAAPKQKKRPDAAPDAEEVALADAGIDAPADGAALATGAYDGSNAGSNDLAAGSGSAGSGSAGSGEGSEVAGAGSGSGSGVPAAVAMGSGSGAPGMDTQPAVDGAPTSAGTAANLLAYFPPGHLVTALVRFDRLRGSEWAKPAEDLFRPMPDYRVLFGARDADLADKLDTLVVSSPSPRDATATTLVAHTHMTRAEMREFLASTPVVWTATRGGMLGTRRSPMQGDKRLVLSPWKNWFVLAQPADVGNWPRVTTSLDAASATAKLPPWLQTIRTIEKESGDDKTKGPALVVTLTGEGSRYNFPDVGLGVTSLPAPQRLSLAMELVPQGWLVRGNIVFASEADATEVAGALLDVQHRIVGSFVMSKLLERQHVLNLVKGLSIARTGARVSYATSISIADARALLAALAATLSDYFVSH